MNDHLRQEGGMRDDGIHALSGAYAVDALSEHERVQFEAHLAGCDACSEEVASLRGAAAGLALLAWAEPPASLRDDVLRQIRTVRPLPPYLPSAESGSGNGTEFGADSRAETTTGAIAEPTAESITQPTTESITQPTTQPITESITQPTTLPTLPAPGHPEQAGAPPTGGNGAPATDLTQRRAQRHVRRERPRRRWLAAVAAGVILVGGGAVVAGLHPWDQSSQTQQLTVADQVLQAPDAQHAEQALAGGGTATVVRSPSVGRAVVVTDDLPAAPAGKVYQLWLQSPTGALTSAGLMPPASDQTVLLDGDASASTGVGITVEPAGGSTQPTTKPIALIPLA